jgi:uncharacterized membrane protein (DUF2068 family)
MTGSTARPTGITILTILAAISGALSILSAIGFIAGGPLLAGVAVGPEASATADAIKSIATVIGVAYLVLGVVQLAFAYGAWTLKPWGRALGIVIEGSSIVLTVVIGLMVGNLAGTLVASIVPLAVAIIIIWYLNTTNVRAAFGQA